MRIVGKTVDAAFIADHIDYALTTTKTVRQHRFTATRIMSRRVGAVAAKAPVPDGLAAFLATHGIADPETLRGEDLDLVRNELERADNSFRTARNYMYVRTNRWACFPVWMGIANSDLIVQSLRLLKGPVGRNEVSRATIQTLRDHAEGQIKGLVSLRLNKIDDALQAGQLLQTWEDLRPAAGGLPCPCVLDSEPGLR